LKIGRDNWLSFKNFYGNPKKIEFHVKKIKERL